MDTSSNPMAQTDAVEQRFAPAPSAVASSATPEQGSASAPDAASANVFNVEGTDIIEGGSIAGLDVLSRHSRTSSIPNLVSILLTSVWSTGQRLDR